MLEIIAVIFTLLSVWFTRKQNILCWLTGMIGTGCYFFLFKQDQAWGNMYLQLIFIAQAIYGWVMWKKSDEGDIALSEPIYLAIWFSMCMTLFTFLCALNLAIDANMTYLDMGTTSISIIAIALTAHKKLENWAYWALADFIYVIFFITTAHYWSAALYLGLLINTYFGYKEWKSYISQPMF
jgi:nicotinamide mononucleotide transporter